MKEVEVTTENLSDEQIHGNKLLHDKVAVIFGAGGATGSSVAREFSKEGATCLKYLMRGSNQYDLNPLCVEHIVSNFRNHEPGPPAQSRPQRSSRTDPSQSSSRHIQKNSLR